MDCDLEAEPSSPALQQAVSSWLEGYESQLQRSGGALALEVNVLELAASQQHNEVVAALLEDPERVREAAMAALADADLLGNWHSVRLRPRQLMAAAELSVPEALECMRAAPGALLSTHGVCIAATAIFQQPASRSFQCASCSKVWLVLGTAAPPACCGGAPLVEVEQARVMVQGQTIYLSSDTPMAAAPALQLGGSVVAVHLLEDLCGRVHVGDRVLATGCGRYYGGGTLGAQPQLPLTLGVKMEGHNVEVLQPAVLIHSGDLGAGALRHLAGMAQPQGGLEGILAVLDAALPVAASPLLKLGLLLSAAAAGTGSTQLEALHEDDPEPEAILHRRRTSSRNQVNVMLTAAAPEPHIQRFLHSLASTLCDHSVCASAADPRRLLPALDAKHVEPSLGLPVPLAVGGQLAEAATGVLLLSSSTLDTKRAIGLGQYMAAGGVALQPGCPELYVPVGTSFWTMVHEQDLSKSGHCSGAAAAARGSGGLFLTERIINKYSLPFFSQHDIVLTASPETEDEVDMMVDSILMGPGSGLPATGSSRQRADALQALQYHVEAARARAQPALSEEAIDLLSAYFMHLRTYEEAQQGVLASLVRLACASARLRHSTQVAVLPDTALAVAFVEERLMAAGASPAFWPRWREELQRCTELGECLRGLVDDCSKALGATARGPEGWAEQPEE